MASPSPYQIEQAMAVLMATRERLRAEDPDIEADESLYSDMLEGESGDAMDVLDAIIRAAIHAEDMAHAASVREAEIAQRRQRYAARALTLRGAAFAAMDALSLKRREQPDFTASVKGGTPSVVITDEKMLPNQAFRVKRTPDKTLIAALLKSDAVIAGAELRNGAPSLQIRSK